MTKQPAPFPLVAPNDDGIRPGGSPDRCCYCQSKVGAPHGDECVVVTKTVRVVYSFTLDIQVPHHWQQDDVESHRNESSSCANDAIVEVAEFFDGSDDENPCACHSFECEYVDTVDGTPRVKTQEPDRSAN